MLESGGREWSIFTSNGFTLATSVTTPTGEKLEVDEAPFLNHYQRNRLHVPVPFSYLAGLEKPFRWDALTLWTIRGQALALR